MPQGDVFYVVNFQNPEADGSHEHFMVIQLHPAQPLRKYLDMYKVSYPQLILDIDQEAKPYTNPAEARAEALRRGDVANQANPNRVGAEHQFAPGETNRILEVGKPGPSDMPGVLAE
jgi:hypothetical protein